MPDVITLVQLSQLFEVTVDDLLRDPEALPEDANVVERTVVMVITKTMKRKADKGNHLQAVLPAGVWFVALLFFVVISSMGYPTAGFPFFMPSR